MSSSVEAPQNSTSFSNESSNNSDDSEATEASLSTSEQKEPSLSTIRYEQRIFVTGATQSGKSHLSKAIFQSTAAPRLVIDPAGSDLTESVVEPGATFHDPKRPPDFATIRFVPRDPEDRDAYDAMYKWAFARFPRYVWLDEAGIAAPASGYPKALNTYIVQGAKRGLGHLACHTRPREVCRNLISQAMHVFVFALPNPDDRRHIADLVGLPPATLEEHMRSLPRYGFLWWSVEAQTLTICPPLPK